MTPFFESADVTIWNADARTAAELLESASVDAIVTSPPYFGLRDYGVDGQIGLEDDPGEYVDTLADLLTGYGERVLNPGGSLWLNLGDTYSSGGGSVNPSDRPDRDRGRDGGPFTVHRAFDRSGGDVPSKCLLMIPERVALALIDRGWILRNKVVWAKPNGMPSSVQDRLATKWEYLFHLVRQPRYFYDLDAIREPHKSAEHRNKYPMSRYVGEGTKHAAKVERGEHGAGWGHLNPAGANPGDVWQIPTQPYPEAHFAVFPPELVRRPILATVPEGGTVLDPFFGSGTTGVMARRVGRKCVGVELNEEYCRLAAVRFSQERLPV